MKKLLCSNIWLVLFVAQSAFAVHCHIIANNTGDREISVAFRHNGSCASCGSGWGVSAPYPYVNSQTIASGGSYDYDLGDRTCGGCEAYIVADVYWRYDPGNVLTNSYYCTGVLYPCNGASVNINVEAAGHHSVSNYFSVCIEIQNTDTVGHYYQLMSGSNPIQGTSGGTSGSTWMWLEPGGSGRLCANGLTQAEKDAGITVKQSNADSTLSSGGGGKSYITPGPTYSPSYSGGQAQWVTNTTPGTWTGGSVGMSTNLPIIYSGNISNINWGAGATNSATDGTIQKGFSALYDGIAKNTAEVSANGKRLDGLGGKLDTINTSVGGVTTAVTDAKNGIMGAISNTAFHGGSTNFDGTGYTNLANQYKNYSDARSAAESAQATALGEIDTMITQVGSGHGAMEGSFADLSVVIPIPGLNGANEHDMTINPITSEFQEVITKAYRLQLFLCILIYASRVVIDLMNFIKTMAQTKFASIPNMNFTILGSGGNLAGITTHATLVVAVMALWAAILGTVFGAWFGDINWNTMFSTIAGKPITPGSSSGVNQGLGLLARFVPLDTVFGLAFAYIVWRLTMLKASLISAVVARFIPAG